MSSGYEIIYERIVNKLADCDFRALSGRLGFEPPLNGRLKVSFLGKEYILFADGVKAADGSEADPKIKSVLVYYTASKGEGEPAGDYCPPEYFVGKMASGGSLSWMTAPLAKRYGKNYEAFDKTLKQLGAVSLGRQKNGEYRWNYRILPKIPMQIVYFPDDGEFPAEIRFLLDKGAGRFLEFEQLAFLCGCLVSVLMNG